jgi:hypothetical protein
MWEPRRLTTLWAFTACYRDSFTLPYWLKKQKIGAKTLNFLIYDWHWLYFLGNEMDCRSTDHSWLHQSSKLLLALASTVVLVIGSHQDQWPYFCSLQTSTCCEMRLSLQPEEGSDYYCSLPFYWGVTLLALTHSLTHSSEYRTTIKSIPPVKAVSANSTFRIWDHSVLTVIFLKTPPMQFYLGR